MLEDRSNEIATFLRGVVRRLVHVQEFVQRGSNRLHDHRYRVLQSLWLPQDPLLSGHQITTMLVEERWCRLADNPHSDYSLAIVDGMRDWLADNPHSGVCLSVQ